MRPIISDELANAIHKKSLLIYVFMLWKPESTKLS